MHHYRSTMRKYKHRRNTDACPFCDPKTLKRALYTDKHLYIVPNLTTYDLWEGHNVERHLLIIPRRHVKSLDDLRDAEKLAIMNQAAAYETDGYNVYARGVGFAARSVTHQHTHLIKSSNKRPQLLVYLRRPYFLLKR